MIVEQNIKIDNTVNHCIEYLFWIMIGVPADGTLKTLSTTACVGAAELENKDEGKFTLEKEKEMEAATDMQLLKSATDSMWSTFTNIFLL